MSGKLDQPLDSLVKSNRRARANGRRAGKGGPRPATNGDVKMTDSTSRISKPSAGPRAKAVPATMHRAAPTAESKIIVTGLPPDVGEAQIQEYFSKTIGPVKKVFLTYGPNGQSKGVATIVFRQANSAHDAAVKLNGVKVDNRAMKIEVVVSANAVPAPAGLGDRIVSNKKAAAAKPTPKSAAATKPVKGRTAGKPKRGRNAGRPKPKTADELDAEMTDYFGPKDAAPAPATNGDGVNGAAPVPVVGDAAMDDQIL